ncbi:hypothetical protein BGZ60DRAFT_363786 [Tricladium varicosporioides]|nr:hypothetical protein BGZ60DRAFT_363786 [Hymenoscyphus varicosporioides]
MSDTSLKSQPPTRKRASTPRSRNGCITCKIRRLKCGEERPGCVRCSKSGWQCDGYEHTIDNSSASSSAGPTSTPGSSNLSRLLPRGSHSPGPSRSRSRSPGQPLLTSYSPQMPSQLDQEERRYFQSFIEESCTNLQDNDIFFWKEAAIQASHSTPCVRHALVAIGALAKSSQRSASGHYFMDAALGVHREFALQQYQKALGALREAISTQENGDASQSTLISCLVLAFFDNFIGNSGFAVQHIRYARKVLYNISDRLRIPPADPSTDSVHQKITRLFLILDMQALCATGHDEDRTVVLAEPQIPNIVIPAIFGSIEEAKRCRDLIMWESCTFKYRTSFSNFVTWQTIPQTDVDLRSYLINKIHFFHAALEPLLASQRLDISGHPLRRGDSIKFDSVTMLISLTLSLNAPEVDSDALMPCFEYLFSLCQEILEYEANLDSTNGKT